MEAVDIWASNFCAALMERKSYASSHYQFQEDAWILKCQLQVFAFSDITIFDFVDPIFLDSVRHGYIDSLHFPALITAFRQWASDNNIPTWQPPADIPLLALPPICRPQKKGRAIRYLEGTTEVQEDNEEEDEPPVVVKPSAGKGREREREQEKKHLAKALKLAEPLAAPTHRTLAEGMSSQKPGPAFKSTGLVTSNADDEHNVNVEESNHPPCKRCLKNKIICLVQPEPKKYIGKEKRPVHHHLACVACRDSKNKCELASKKPRSPSLPMVSAPPHPDEEPKVIPTLVKVKCAPKKKLQVVPQGGPGENTSQLPYIFTSMFLTHV